MIKGPFNYKKCSVCNEKWNVSKRIMSRKKPYTCPHCCSKAKEA